MEVNVRLLNHGCFFAGEKFVCHVVISRPLRDVESPDAIPPKLSWCAIQLQGSCLTDKLLLSDTAVVGLEATDSSHAGFASAFLRPPSSNVERLHIFFSTSIIVLCNDISLDPGSSRTYVYETILPINLPPTHRGKAVRFGYKVLVAAASNLSPQPELVRVSFRLFNAVQESGQFYSLNLQSPICSHPSNHVAFCEEERQQLLKLRELKLSRSISDNSAALFEAPEIDDLLPHYESFQNWQNITTALQATRSTARSVFNLSNAEGLIARLYLPRLSHRLGDVFEAIFDFSASACPCVQFSTSLDIIEDVDEKVALKSKEATARSTRQIVAEYTDRSVHLKQTSVLLAIPIDITPSFTTSAVSVRWQLRCDFVVASSGEDQIWAIKEAHPDHFLVSLPATIKSELFSFDVPITVYPTIPENAQIATMAKTITLASLQPTEPQK